MQLQRKNKQLDILLDINRNVKQNVDGLFCARAFVFFRQFVRDKIEYERPFSKVACRGMYNRHKLKFDKLKKEEQKSIDEIGGILYHLRDNARYKL